MGQGPFELALGADGRCLEFFSLAYHFFPSPSLGEGLIKIEILSQRAIKPKRPAIQNKEKIMDRRTRKNYTLPPSAGDKY